MKAKTIHLGYEIEEGKEVEVRLSHLVVTGVTQLSGKTTTLEALIKRSGLKAIVFKTKTGEKSFTSGTEIAPYFKDRSDYEFVKSLIEAYAKEKLHLEKGTLMRLSKQTAGQGLIGLKKSVDETIAEGKLRGLKEEIYTRLQHYLENIIPQIQYSNLSKTLDVYDGINIMNLERFSEEAQSLIIEATVSEILNNMKGVIVVVPEAWKFLPQKYNNPCKRSVESFIRQGATNNNYLWIDSQDMAGVDKIPLKQVSTWILGYQSERNEVKHTLDQISLPKKLKPKEDEIMTLKIGQFYLSSYDGVVKAYVQPSWLDDETAKKIAKGEMESSEVVKPESIVPYSVSSSVKQNTQTEKETNLDSFKRDIESRLKNELVELRQDFFNKIQEIQNYQNKMTEEIYKVGQNIPEVNVDEIVSKVLQKMPSSVGSNGNINKEEIIQEVLSRVPKVSGSITYEVAPLEKIKKNFLEEAKNKILSDISSLDDQQKKILKWIEQKGSASTKQEIFLNCFGKSATGGSTYKTLVPKVTEIKQKELIRIDTTQRIYPRLQKRIEEMIEQYGATKEEISQVYNHILAELL